MRNSLLGCHGLRNRISRLFRDSGQAAARFERLEDRQLLDAVAWIGGDGGSWDNPNNWLPNGVPTADDDVKLNVVIPGTQINMSPGAVARSVDTDLPVPLAKLVFAGSDSLRVTAPSRVAALELSGGTLDAADLNGVSQPFGAADIAVNSGFGTPSVIRRAAIQMPLAFPYAIIAHAGADLVFDGGAVAGLGSIVVADGAQVTSRNNWFAAVPMNIASGATYNREGGFTLGEAFTNSGTMNISNGVLDLANQTFNNLGVLNLGVNANLVWQSGPLSLSGTIRLDSPSSVISGAGDLTINGRLEYTTGSIAGFSHQLVIGAGATMSRLPGNPIDFVCERRIINNGIIDLGTGTTTIQQGLTGQVGSVLNIPSGANVNAIGGQILLPDGSTINVSGSISGNGTLVIGGDAAFSNGANLGVGVTLEPNGNATVNGNASFGAFAADGSVTVNPLAALNLLGTMTVGPNGTISFNGSGTGPGVLVAHGEVNVNGVTVSHAVTIEADGSLTASGAASFGPVQILGSFGVTPGSDVTAEGVFYVGGDAVVEVAGRITTEGIVEAYGSLVFAGGTLVVEGPMTMAGGTIVLPNGSTIEVPGVMDVYDSVVTFAGTIITEGTTRFAGSTVVVWEGVNDIREGAEQWFIGQARLIINANRTLAEGAAMFFREGARLDINANFIIRGTIDLDGEQLVVAGPGLLDVIGTLRLSRANMIDLVSMTIHIASEAYMLPQARNATTVFPQIVTYYAPMVFEAYNVAIQQLIPEGDDAILRFERGALDVVSTIVPAGTSEEVFLTGTISLAADVLVQVDRPTIQLGSAVISGALTASFVMIAPIIVTAQLIYLTGPAVIVDTTLAPVAIGLVTIDSGLLAIENGLIASGIVDILQGGELRLGGGSSRFAGEVNLDGQLTIAPGAIAATFEGAVSGSGHLIANAPTFFESTLNAGPGADIDLFASASFFGDVSIDPLATVRQLGGELRAFGDAIIDGIWQIGEDVTDAVFAGAVAVNDTLSIATATVFEGTVNVFGVINAPDVSIVFEDTLFLCDGAINTGGLQALGIVNWCAGLITGSANASVFLGADLNIYTTGLKQISIVNVVANGDVNWTGGDIVGLLATTPGVFILQGNVMRIGDPAAPGTLRFGNQSLLAFENNSTGRGVEVIAGTADIESYGLDAPGDFRVVEGATLVYSGIQRLDGRIWGEGNLSTRGNARAFVGGYFGGFFGEITVDELRVLGTDSTWANFEGDVITSSVILSVAEGLGAETTHFRGSVSTGLLFSGDVGRFDYHSSVEASDIWIAGGTHRFLGGVVAHDNVSLSDGHTTLSSQPYFLGTANFTGGDVVLTNGANVLGALQFTGGTVVSDGNFVSAETPTFTGGQHTFRAGFAPTELLRLENTSVTFDSLAFRSFGVVELIDSTLAGKSSGGAITPFDVRNSLFWSGGEIRDLEVAVDVAQPVTLRGQAKVLSSTDPAASSSLTFGDMLWEAGDLTLDDGADISGTTISKVGGGSLRRSGAGQATLQVGNFNHSAPLTTEIFATWVPRPLDHMNIAAGTVRFHDLSQMMAGGTLLPSRWTVASGAVADLVGATIRTNQADITLNGPNAVMSALGGLTTNSGRVAYLGSQPFTPSPLGGALTNAAGGLIELGGAISRSPSFQINNTGVVRVLGGTLSMPGGTNSGEIFVASGATLAFNVNHSHSGAAIITGTGSVTMTGGTQTITGTLRVSPSLLVTNEGARVNGSGDLLIAGPLTWNGNAQMAGTGRAIFESTSVVTFDGMNGDAVVRRTIENFGIIDHSGGRIFGEGPNWINRPGGTFNLSLTTGHAFIHSNASATIPFTNEGVFNRTGNAGSSNLAGSRIAFNNTTTGVVNVLQGTLDFNTYVGTNSSDFVVAVGAALRMSSSGDYTHADGATISGAGNVSFLSGTHLFTGTVRISAPLLITNSSTTIGGAGDLRIEGPLTWNGNARMSGTGRTIFESTSAVTFDGMNGDAVARRTIENFGIVNHSGGRIFGEGPNWINRPGGTFNLSLTTGYAFTHSNASATVLFTNEGVFNRTGNAGASNLASGRIAFNNTTTGVVNVLQGALDFGTFSGTNSNDFVVAAGAALRMYSYGDYTHTDGATFSGPGTVSFLHGTHLFTGTVRLRAPLLVTNSSTTIGGAGNLRIEGPLTWNGNARMSGTGRTIFESTSVVTFDGVNGDVLALRTIENFGIINHSGGRIIAEGPNWINRPGGTFNLSLTTGHAFAHTNGGGTVFFTNEGVFNRMGNGGSSTLTGNLMVCNNTGEVRVSQGTLNFNPTTFTQRISNTLTGGRYTVLAGASLVMSAGLTTIGTGATVTLSGVGSSFDAINTITAVQGTFVLQNGRSFTTAGPLTNTGTIDLGTNLLTVNGNYTQTSSGTLALSVAGRSTGQFGRLVVNGVASLAGGLRWSALNGFALTGSDNLRIVTCTTRNGSFQSVHGPRGRITITPDGVTLSQAPIASVPVGPG